MLIAMGASAGTSDVYQVKGSSIRSKLEFVRERFGEQAERELAKDLAEAGVPRVLEASWYPYELYDRVLQRIAERHYGGELEQLREVGEFSARHSLAGTYAVYSDLGAYERLLERLPALHDRFYNLGSSRVELDEGAHRATLELHGAPRYTETDLQIAAGFYQGAGEAMGCRDIEVELELQADGARFHIRWRPPLREGRPTEAGDME
jgi:hypothetical protein